MELANEDFIQLYAKLYVCANSDGVEQLDIYNQLKSLYDYFDNCVFEDKNLEEGRTYILPLDMKIGFFDELDYEEFTNPASDDYSPDLAPFVESHNKVIWQGVVWITLKAGTQFVYNGCDRYAGEIMLVDGYPVECYGGILDTDDNDLPYVIKA